MTRNVLRTAVVTAGALLAAAAFAAPAVADAVPEGCVGTVYYACTGDAEPPRGWAYTNATQVVTVPVALTAPETALVPGMTVGGQQVGGVVIAVGGEVVPGQTVTVGGPIGPFSTGVIAPVNVCLLVTCLIAGEPIVVPGVTAPVVPVVIPPVVAPSETVTVPTVGTVPEQSTPPVAVPETTVVDTALTIYVHPQDVFLIGVNVCMLGGGGLYYDYDAEEYRCYGGVTAPVADLIFRWAAGG